MPPAPPPWPAPDAPAAAPGPTARSASQPRWTATEASPSSPAIHAATLRLVHSPPSGGGPARRARSLSSSAGFRIVGLVPLRRRRSPNASGPPALYRASSFTTHRTPNAVVEATSRPFASSRIAWTCRAERVSAATRNRSPSSATLECPATSATCPPPASRGPAYRPRHPAGTVHRTHQPETVSLPAIAAVPGVRARVAPARDLGQPAEVVGPAFRVAGALLGVGQAGVGQAQQRPVQL